MPSDKPPSNKKKPTKPSRSEIEKALSAKTSTKKKRLRSKPQNVVDLSSPPRRQKVIGGDLSGISSQRQKRFFTRYSGVNLINWSALAVVMVIVIAFFWPQEQTATKEIQALKEYARPQLGETDLSEDEQIDFLIQETGQTELSFSRDDDEARAQVFRRQDAEDKKIRELLERANSEINNGNYTEPADANATDTYRAVLAINPKNVQAKQGLEYIKSRFLDTGLSALEQNNQSIAENALSKLERISRSSDEYLELSEAIDTWALQRRISILLSNAQSSYSKRALILPAKANSLYFYQQVLLLDESNEQASLGIQKIADHYIQLANDAALTAQFEAASAHLQTAAIIDPNHSSIALVEAMIARAKPRNTVSSNSDSSTPEQQTTEQEAFDREYLKQGLEAYQQGDYETASALLQPLADKGITRAQFRLAYMHFLGRGFNRNRQLAEIIISSALPSIQKFADEGRAWAQTDLGNLYEDGLVLEQQYSSAVSWYQAAADQGYARAQTNLGSMYARGLGVETDRDAAIKWFELAAAQGDNSAQINLDAINAN